MQRHETTPDDEAEALQYHSGYVRAELSKFISDNCDASNRTRMLTNRPRTIRISLQRSF